MILQAFALGFDCGLEAWHWERSAQGLGRRTAGACPVGRIFTTAMLLGFQILQAYRLMQAQHVQAFKDT